MTEPRLIRNAIRCKKCNDIIESKHHYDFKYCSCGSIFVDGGKEYCRYGWPGGLLEDWIESLTEYEDESSSLMDR